MAAIARANRRASFAEPDPARQQAELVSAARERDAAVANVQAATREAAMLRKQLDADFDDRRYWHDRLSSIRQEQLELNEQLATSEQEKQAVQSQLDAVVSENTLLQSQLGHLREEKLNLQGQVRISKQERVLLTSECGALTKELEVLRARLLNARGDESKIAQEVKSMQQDVAAAKRELDLELASLGALKGRHEALKEERDKERQAVRQTKHESRALETQVGQVDGERLGMKNQLKSEVNTRKQLQSKLARLDAEAKALQSQVASAQSQNKALTSSVEQADGLKQRLLSQVAELEESKQALQLRLQGTAASFPSKRSDSAPTPPRAKSPLGRFSLRKSTHALRDDESTVSVDVRRPSVMAVNIATPESPTGFMGGSPKDATGRTPRSGGLKGETPSWLKSPRTESQAASPRVDPAISATSPKTDTPISDAPRAEAPSWTKTSSPKLETVQAEHPKAQDSTPKVDAEKPDSAPAQASRRVSIMVASKPDSPVQEAAKANAATKVDTEKPDNAQAQAGRRGSVTVASKPDSPVQEAAKASAAKVESPPKRRLTQEQIRHLLFDDLITPKPAGVDAVSPEKDKHSAGHHDSDHGGSPPSEKPPEPRLQQARRSIGNWKARASLTRGVAVVEERKEQPGPPSVASEPPAAGPATVADKAEGGDTQGTATGSQDERLTSAETPKESVASKDPEVPAQAAQPEGQADVPAGTHAGGHPTTDFLGVTPPANARAQPEDAF